MTIGIGDAAKELGISVITLRRWADSGKIRLERSPSGQRRFLLTDIKRITPRKLNQLENRITIKYAVSSHDQKEYLVPQVQVLEAFSAANGWQFETIQDLVLWLKLPEKKTAKIA